MIEVRGADQLARLSRELKEAGNKELQRELSRAISQALKPVVRAARQSAASRLPDRGGLAQRVAKSRMRTVRRSSGRGQGLRLQATNAYGLGQLDKGISHHPVFGNRNVWVKQSVPSGWWTDPTEAAAPRVRQELLAALRQVASKIEGAV